MDQEELLDDDVAFEEELDTLDLIKKSHSIKLSVSHKYTDSWEPREAFREMLQNW